MHPRATLKPFLLFNIAILLFAASYASAQAGELDNTFASGGIFTAPSATSTENAVAIQSDGKIVVAGLGALSNGDPVDTLLRLNTNGTLDTSFGVSGVANISPTGAIVEEGFFGVVIQSDGKIVVAGAITSKVNAPQTANDIGFGIVRYNSNGSLDGTFGTRGVAITDFGATANDSGAFALAVQSNGDIVAAGAAGVSSSATFTSSSFGLSRYTSAGKLDTTFGTGGITITTIGSGHISFVNALAIQSDGKIVAAGTSTLGIQVENGYVARYLSQ